MANKYWPFFMKLSLNIYNSKVSIIQTVSFAALSALNEYTICLSRTAEEEAVRAMRSAVKQISHIQMKDVKFRLHL